MLKIKNIILIIIFVAFAVLCATFGLGLSDGSKALAEDYVAVESITSTYLSGFDASGSPLYVYGADYNTYFFNSANPYGKDIRVTFALSNDVAYYKIECVRSGAEAPEGTRLEDVPSEKLAYCDIDDSGVFVVTCFAYSDTEVLLATESVTVKSDYDAPSMPTANDMDTWIAQGVTFDAILDWSECNDPLSGVKCAYYQVIYDDGNVSDLKKLSELPVDRTYIPLTKSGKIEVTLYDNAGNYSRRNFVYNMFDGVPPMAPSYEVTPNIESGKYANKYTITLHYYQDNESGLATSQYYLMNRTSYLYEGDIGIVLEEQKNYEFTFYAMDKVGNRSEYVRLEIPSTAFDVKGPYLNPEEVMTEIDLMNENGVCLLTFNASDYKESGIKSARIKGKDYVFNIQDMTSYYSYSLRFDCFEEYVSRIVLTDYAENVTEHLLIIDYFTDEKINAMCAELTELYRSTDFSGFSTRIKNKFVDAYMAVNYLLNTTGNDQNDFVRAYNEAKALYSPVAETKYVIETVPLYASPLVSYTISQEDFAGRNLGNSLELTMKKDESVDTEYVELAGFSDGFSDWFSLVLTLNGEEISAPLTQGIKITMNLPASYMDRAVKLFDRTTGQEVETTIINNKLNYTMKRSSSYALVIGGSKTPTEYTVKEGDSSTIEVFGRKWPLGTFLGIVIGIGGGAIVAVVLLLVLGKKG